MIEDAEVSGAVLNALPTPVLTVDDDNRLSYLNAAAEAFMEGSQAVLLGAPMHDLIPADSPVMRMIEQSRRIGVSLSEYDLLLEMPRTGPRLVNVQTAPVTEQPGKVAVTFQERSIANRLHSQMSSRGAARSVSSMARMLAHEVKNPLSGIRGAAQLLEQDAGPDGQSLTQLICEEADRICGLVDRMEVFADGRPIEREALNIHEILDYVRRLASTGFGRDVRFTESYDPSLPPVLGNRDLLIQVLINLLKNACEAVPQTGGEVHVATSYRHGMRVQVGGSGHRVHLPLQITIRDNGSGIPEDIMGNLFEPFVTTKINGTGLGLAFVAKTVADHGGVIEVDSSPRGTTFRLTLPIAEDER